MPPLLLPEVGYAIASNTNAKFVFIDNLAPETGPAGRMTLEQKLQWVERSCQARKIDTVIGEGDYSAIADDWNCNNVELASPNRVWRHDRTKLQNAIENLL